MRSKTSCTQTAVVGIMCYWGTYGYIKVGLEEVGRGCGDWMELAQDRDRWRALVSTVMNFGVP